MISLVVVSHSRPLAEAALDLAQEMVNGDPRPQVRIAAGLGGGSVGTDAVAIAGALQEVDAHDGVLVLVDLGSAVLSAELALDLVDPSLAERVVISPAPLLEGLVAGLVTAAGGASLERVDAEARAALNGKIAHLGEGRIEHPGSTTGQRQDSAGSPVVDFRFVLTGPHGLHARPAAALARAMAAFDATVLVHNATSGGTPAPAASISQLAMLGLSRGDELYATFEGPDAVRARDALAALATAEFGEANQAERLSRARTLVASTISSLPATGVTASVLAAVAQMVQDPALTKRMTALLAEGATAADAAHRAHAELAQRFTRLNNRYLALRAQDVRAIDALVQRALSDEPLLQDIEPGVLVVNELDVVTAARIDPELTPEVLVVAPGDQAHGAIVARERGIKVTTGYQRTN